MSFADLLGSIAGDLMRGRTRSIEYKVRNYLASSAEKAVKEKVKSASEEKKEDAPPKPNPAPGSEEETAWLLLRAMISAAAADGEFDSVEREAIMAKAQSAELSEQDMKALEAEMQAPQSPEAIARLATDEYVKEQVYALSLSAIEVDTDAEKTHLQRLARAMQLSDEAVARIEADLTV